MRLLSALLVSVVARTYALTCYQCYGSSYHENFMGECFNINTIACNCTGAKYCETRFSVDGGITTSVNRGCGYEEKTGEGWYTDDHYSTSTFVKYCDEKDLCNDDPPSGFKTCTKECINGECDYIIGECACHEGYKGDICNTTNATPTPKIRKCHQCSSDYDGEACADEITGQGTECLNGENYCSITKATVFDTDMIALKNVTVRGCTDSMLLPDCGFNPINNGGSFNIQPYWEYICFETCDTDSCNQKLSGDVADKDDSDLYCLQCPDTLNNCDTGPSLCPYGTKYCISTVVYTISEKVGRHKEDYPDYQLWSVVRGCANESVIPECKEEQAVGENSIKKVTCSETCEQYGCNAGWPARPKCVFCDSQRWYSCVENPPFPESCERPCDSYCYIRDEKIKSTSATSGYARRLVRGCSHYDSGNSCATTRNGDTEFESCNRTCTTDGCNVGSGGEITLQILPYVLLAALFAILLQNMN